MMGYIYIEDSMHDSPKVISMSDKLGIDRFGIIGRLYRVRSWFAAHSIDGRIEHATTTMIDEITLTPGFADAMVAFGMLERDANAIVTPNFKNEDPETLRKKELSRLRSKAYRERKAMRDEEPTVTLASRSPSRLHHACVTQSVTQSVTRHATGSNQSETEIGRDEAGEEPQETACNAAFMADCIEDEEAFEQQDGSVSTRDPSRTASRSRHAEFLFDDLDGLQKEKEEREKKEKNQKKEEREKKDKNIYSRTHTGARAHEGTHAYAREGEHETRKEKVANERAQQFEDAKSKFWSIFNRRPSTKPTDKEIKAITKLLPINEEDMALIMAYYLADIPKDSDYRRRDALTLANNFNTEVDRARAFVGGNDGIRRNADQNKPKPIDDFRPWLQKLTETYPQYATKIEEWSRGNFSMLPSYVQQDLQKLAGMDFNPRWHL